MMGLDQTAYPRYHEEFVVLENVCAYCDSCHFWRSPEQSVWSIDEFQGPEDPRGNNRRSMKNMEMLLAMLFAMCVRTSQIWILNMHVGSKWKHDVDPYIYPYIYIYIYICISASMCLVAFAQGGLILIKIVILSHQEAWPWLNFLYSPWRLGPGSISNRFHLGRFTPLPSLGAQIYFTRVKKLNKLDLAHHPPSLPRPLFSHPFVIWTQTLMFMICACSFGCKHYLD